MRGLLAALFFVALGAQAQEYEVRVRVHFLQVE